MTGDGPKMVHFGPKMAKHGRLVNVPKRGTWGSTSSPPIGDVVMSLFLLWGQPFMTGDGPKMVLFGPKMAKHGRPANVPKWSKRVQKGPKWPT